MAEPAAEVNTPPPKKVPSHKVQDLQAKGDVLAKAWTDLFSFVTEYQAELALKESLLDIAEMEIATRKKQQEEMRMVIEGGDEAVAKLQSEMADKETELRQTQYELKTKEQLLQSVQSDFKKSKQSNEKLQGDVAAKEKQVRRIQLELKSKEQCLQSVQTDLKNSKELNEKLNKKKSEFLTSQTEIARLKSELIMKNSLYSKLSQEHEELKSELDVQVKTVGLERKSLEMERKAHDMTKQSLLSTNGNKNAIAPLEEENDDHDDHDDGMDYGMDNGDDPVDSDNASPPTSPEKPMRVSKRKKTPSVRQKALKSAALPKSVQLVVRKGGKGNIVSFASSQRSSTVPKVTQPSQETTSTDTPTSSSETYFPLTLSLSSNTTSGDDMDTVLLDAATTAASTPGTPKLAKAGPPAKKARAIPTQRVRDQRQSGSIRDAWTDADMSMAIKDVQDGVMKIRPAADHYNVPKTTLAERIHGKIKFYADSLGEGMETLSREDERKIHDFINEEEKIGHVVTKSRVQAYAEKLVADMGKKGMYDFGDDWYRSLIMRVRHSGPWKKRKRKQKEMFDC